MKMREEIDALRTMGRNPLEVLVLPRIVALVVALPLLALIGSMAALVGGGVVASMQGMEPSLYIARLREAVSISDFEVGMIKAPFMALVIGLVACAEGFQVRGSSQSLGARTTSSVVKAIFLVIALDGFFAMFFSSIGM
jgi:phospholipid/cholesterol/gamma-HCH transport system permease protein